EMGNIPKSVSTFILVAFLSITLFAPHLVKAESESSESIMSLRQNSGSVQELGFLLGYNDGINGEQRSSWEQIPVPETFSGKDDIDYRKGYNLGYDQGLWEVYPVQAALGWLWDGITSWFANIFSRSEQY
ncbi:TPA: hypothetical protein ACQNOC_000924, partial [Streptococcus pyogenes]